MKFLRNPMVVGLLAVVAVVVVLYQLLAPRWQRAKESRVATVDPPSSAQSQPPKSAATEKAHEIGAEKTLEDEPSMDRSYLASHLAAWANAPQRDPFLLLGTETPTVKGSAETNSPLSHWKLRAIWDQTGARL